VAVSDPDGILATPLVTVQRPQPVPGKAQDASEVTADMREIAGLAGEHEVVEIVVGLPVNLAGTEGPAAKNVRDYARILGELLSPIPIVMADERMSTVAATRRLSDRGVKGKRQRAVVDQAAAVEILQSYLDRHRRRD
jgi:putative Holliday junction resolvase